MISNVSSFFVKVDNVCDYIPVISTLTNLTDLFQKRAVLPFMSTESIVNSHYYTHLKEKAILRCVILLIPVIGNIIIGIYDFANRYNGRNSTSSIVQQNGRAFESSNDMTPQQDAIEELRHDREVVLAAVQQRQRELNHQAGLPSLSETLSGARRIVLESIRHINSILSNS